MLSVIWVPSGRSVTLERECGIRRKRDASQAVCKISAEREMLMTGVGAVLFTP